ncbi:unnamed protein product [Mytilus coruscus]|uniref:Uncharacterized protein n=1 Tax=Mytilus coruscus TaxID=42192 RepID=A0A6J8ACX5_MYTCO|nr:unnamed protein product [Mytilus coruscus]
MTTPKSLEFENGEDNIKSCTNHHTIPKSAHVNEINQILSTNSEILSTNSEILQEEDQINLKTPENVPVTLLQSRNENTTINTDSINSVSNEPHSISESSQIQQRLSILEESTINMSSEILNAHSSIKNFETLLSMNLQGLRNDIVQDVIKLLNKVETSPESIETLKQVHARELKMLREKCKNQILIRRR